MMEFKSFGKTTGANVACVNKSCSVLQTTLTTNSLCAYILFVQQI